VHIKKSLDEMLRTLRDEKPAQEGLSWQQFQERAQPSLDPFGRPVLQADLADKPVALGISRGSFFGMNRLPNSSGSFSSQRLRAELAAGRSARRLQASHCTMTGNFSKK